MQCKSPGIFKTLCRSITQVRTVCWENEVTSVLMTRNCVWWKEVTIKQGLKSVDPLQYTGLMENKGLSWFLWYHCGGGPRAGRCHCAHLLASFHPAVSSRSVSVMSVPADDFSVQTVVWGPAHAWPPILKQQWLIKALVLKLCICILDNEKQRIKSAQTQHCNESLPHKVYSLKFFCFVFCM